MPGIEALKRSSFASASSRSESRTLHRTAGPRRRGQLLLDASPLRGGRGSTPRPGRGAGRPRPALRTRPSTAGLEGFDGLDTGLGADGLRDRRDGPVGPGSRKAPRRAARAGRAAVSRPRPRGSRTCRHRSGRTAPSAREATTFAQTISTSRSRPKNSIASIARVGERRQALVRRGGKRFAHAARHPVEPPVEQDGEGVLVDLDGPHVEVAPERQLERRRRRAHGPRFVRGADARRAAG